MVVIYIRQVLVKNKKRILSWWHLIYSNILKLQILCKNNNKKSLDPGEFDLAGFLLVEHLETMCVSKKPDRKHNKIRPNSKTNDKIYIQKVILMYYKLFKIKKDYKQTQKYKIAKNKLFKKILLYQNQIFLTQKKQTQIT